MTLEALFASVLSVPAETLSEETSPDNTAEWDSLRHIQLVTAVEKTYSLRLSLAESLELRSIGDFRRTLAQKGVSA